MAIVSVYVGLDYHEDSVRVCVLDPNGETLANRDVANDPRAVRDVVSRCGSPRGIAIEACCGAANFAAELERQTKWKVRMAHPGYVRRLKQGPDKSDHDDAWLLADLVRVNYLPDVWLADETTRQWRRLVRHRQGLIAERKNIKLRIRALLREERMSTSLAKPWTKVWTYWLRTLRLGEHSRWVLDEELLRLERLNQDIARAEERLVAAVGNDPLAKRLMEQPGIGLITAATLRAEVGNFDRFKSGKQLARFCGVTPCNASSGKRQADAGLVKAGNRELRAVLIQTAQRLPRHEPRWRDMKLRLCRTKPANVATAAIANRWLRWLYHQMVTVPQVANV
jgi:transposase